MSYWPPDYCFLQFKAKLDLLRSSVGTNEATTRLRAIDTMLFDVLGWNKLDVDAETYCRAAGFADYALRTDNAFSMILEAKKDGQTFVVPERKFGTAPSAFALLARECREADEALRQAMGYANGLGARFVAITNGHQWLLALTFVQNQTVDERLVIVFDSLAAIEDKFRHFWNAFSPAGIAANRAVDHLLDVQRAPPPRKLSQNINVYPAPADRNTLSASLRTILGAVWEEIKQDEDEIEFLNRCYVKPEIGDSAISLAKELLEQKLASDERVYASPVKPGNVIDVLKGYTSEKPIVVLGDVGTGKTIFLKHLRKIDAANTLDRYIQLEIDFVDRPTAHSEVPAYIYARIEEQLQRPPHQIDLLDDTLIRGALNADLNRFRKSPDAKAFAAGTADYVREELKFINGIRENRHEFLTRVFVHLRGSRKFSVALFFDNLDRRDPKIQDEAYLAASAIARDWGCLVFVCLRPTTFYQSSSSGVLDSVAPKLIMITSPNVDHVLVRRLKFGKEYAEGSALPLRSRAPLGSTSAFELPKVSLFLECLAESFRHNRELGALFQAVSNGNTRELLKSTYQFITSLHLNANEIVEKYGLDPKYRVPAHHALRALLYGDFLHYDPKRSKFTNVFDLQQANPQEHFTRVTVLHFLSTVPTASPTFGFAKLSQILAHLSQAGYTNSHAAWTLRLLFERRCIESRDPLEVWSDDVKELRVTDLGTYHISQLMKEFNYFDAMTVDTPVLDDEARRQIVDTLSIRARLERCLIFTGYLDRASTRMLDVQAKRHWTDCYESVQAQMAWIQDRLDYLDEQHRADDDADLA